MSTEGKRCRRPFVLSTAETLKQLAEAEEFAKQDAERGDDYTGETGFLVKAEWLLRIAEIVRSKLEGTNGEQRKS